MKTIFTLIFFTLTIALYSDEQKLSEQDTAVIKMNSLIQEDKFGEFYDTYIHPSAKEQANKEEFIKMLNEKGTKEKLKELFKVVTNNINLKNADLGITSQFQKDKSEYEYIISKNKGTEKFWHLELKLNDKKWLFTDWD